MCIIIFISGNYESSRGQKDETNSQMSSLTQLRDELVFPKHLTDHAIM